MIHSYLVMINTAQYYGFLVKGVKCLFSAFRYIKNRHGNARDHTGTQKKQQQHKYKEFSYYLLSRLISINKPGHKHSQQDREAAQQH